MKKLFIGFLLGAMGLTMAACGLQGNAVDTTETGLQEILTTEANTQGSEHTVPDASEEEIYHGMGNPWVDSDKECVLEATGFDLAAPAGATNVAYSYMPSTGMAQLNYTMDSAMWVYRVQPTDALEDISGIYCAWDYTEKTKVAGMDAMEYSYASEPAGEVIDSMDCTRVINWFDAQNKVTHSLCVIGTDLNGMDTIVYAEKLINPAAGAPESVGAGSISEENMETGLYKSFLGHHVSGYDGSEITIKESVDKGKLRVNVNLFRLCSLDDGIGIYENDAVSFHATDPNGNAIKCCLFYDSENSVCLEVEESSWEYLPTGTIICGFDN